MIRRTIFAAAVENPRYAVTGVLWELEEAVARLVKRQFAGDKIGFERQNVAVLPDPHDLAGALEIA